VHGKEEAAAEDHGQLGLRRLGSIL
jgi:hypothetical protein